MASNKSPADAINENDKNPYLPPSNIVEVAQPQFDFTSYLPHPVSFEYTFTIRDIRNISLYPWIIGVGALCVLLCFGIILHFLITDGRILTVEFPFATFFPLFIGCIFIAIGFGAGSVGQQVRANQDLLGPGQVTLHGKGIQFKFAQTSAAIPWEGVIGCMIRRHSAQLVFEPEPRRALVLNQNAIKSPVEWEACLRLFRELKQHRQPSPSQQQIKRMTLMRELPWEPLPVPQDEDIVASVKGDILVSECAKALGSWRVFLPFSVMLIPFVIQLATAVQQRRGDIIGSIPCLLFFVGLPLLIVITQRFDKKVANRLQMIVRRKTITIDTPLGVWTYDLALVNNLKVRKQFITFRIGKKGPRYTLPTRLFSSATHRQEFINSL